MTAYMESTQTADILGYRISSRGLEGDITDVVNRMEENGKHAYMACANPHSLVQAKSDPDFAQALQAADLLLPDGAGILLAAKWLGKPIRERVAGNEFFLALMTYLNSRRGRVFFLGSTEEVLEKLVAAVNHQFPDVIVSGCHSPPFRTEFSEQENLQMCHLINAAEPDVLWVGMTAPKQEKWIYHNRARLNVKFIGAIGAVFDFVAGTKKRAPQWVCRVGLEWLPRLLREPKRLWRRNFVSTPLFLYEVLRRMGQRTTSSDGKH